MQPTPRIATRRVLFSAAVAVAASSSLLRDPSPAAAVTRTWTTTAGSWNTPSNWSPSGVPTSGDVASILRGPVNPLIIPFNANYTPATRLQSLVINSATAVPVALEQSLPGFDLYAQSVTLATTGRATFTHSASTHSLTGFLFLGNAAGSTGHYSLSDTGSLRSSITYVGNAGTGSFTQSGGTHVATSALVLGQSAGSTGHYSLSASSSLSVGSSVIGASGRGAFTHSGGSHAVTDTLYIGGTVGTTGSYSLSGTGALSARDIDIGGDSSSTFGGPRGTGALLIAGGAASVANTLKVWDTPGTTLSLSAGSLSVGSLNLSGNPARFNWTGGSLQLSASAAGVGPSALFGPSLSLPAGKNLAALAGLHVEPGGALSLAGGSLTTPAVTNFGTFTQTAGSLNITGTFVNFGNASFSGDGARTWSPHSVFLNAGGFAAFEAPLSPDGAGPAVHVTGGSVTFSAPQSLPHLAVTSGSVLLGGNSPLSLASLAFGPGTAGTLDIRNDPLAVSSTTPDQFRSDLLAGRIFSSAANEDPDQRLGVGLATAAQINVTTWGGFPVDPTTVLAKLTYLGDANLDDVLNADDFALLDKGFATGGTHWHQGDFTHDGQVDQQDYLALDRTYLSLQAQGFQSLGPLLSLRASQFGPTYVSQLLTSILEPSSPACLLAALPLRYRRKPKHLS